MKYFVAAWIGLLMSHPSPAAVSFACPDQEQGETAKDCPWAGIARALLSEKKLERKKLEAVLKAQAKGLYDQIRSERKSKALHSLWGKSINFDELAKGIIVDPRILKAFYSLSGVEPSLGKDEPQNIEHAGLEHTYGYLFSLLKTQFGYKRARWVQGEIDRGFDLEGDVISPNTVHGSLFRNVTYFVGKIAFRKDPTQLAVLDKNRGGVAPALVKFQFESLHPTRLEEVIRVGEKRTVVLRTDFVPFTAPSGGANDQLLIYSYSDSLEKKAKLISAFPVGKGFVAGVLKPESLGTDQPVMTRYNAYIPGVTGVAGLKGTRTVTEGVGP